MTLQERCRWTILDCIAFAERSGEYDVLLACIRFNQVASRIVWDSETEIREEMKLMEAEGLLDLGGDPVMTEAGRVLREDLYPRIRALPDEEAPSPRRGNATRTFVLRPPLDEDE